MIPKIKHALKLAVLLSLAMSPFVTGKEVPWQALSYSLPGIAGQKSQDSFIQIMVTPESDDELSYGPILLWKQNEEKKPLQLSHSITALARAINSILPTLNEPDQREAIKIAIGNYIRSARSTILVGYERDAAIKRAANDRAKLLESLPDLKEVWTDTNWNIEFFIITGNGDIEKNTFTGTRFPFKIARHLVEPISEFKY